MKGCDLLGKKDSDTGPRQTEHFPHINGPQRSLSVSPLSLCRPVSLPCFAGVNVNTSSPSNIPQEMER